MPCSLLPNALLNSVIFNDFFDVVIGYEYVNASFDKITVVLFS